MDQSLPQEVDQLKTLIIGMFDREISTPLIRFVVDTIVNSCFKVNPELKIKPDSVTFLHCRVSLAAVIPGDATKTTQPKNDLEEYMLYNAKRCVQDFDFPIGVSRTDLIKALSRSKVRLEQTYDCSINAFQHTDKGVSQLVIELHSNALNRPLSIKVNV